jgi:pyruvate kinase
MLRGRNCKIVATLGPATADPAMIAALFEAGADVFRLNLSHGAHSEHQKVYDAIRKQETTADQPITVLLDLQGPKLRVGRFAEGSVHLKPGASFRLDLTDQPGDAERVTLPHPEIFDALDIGTEILLDDGRIRLKAQACGADFADFEVVTGGTLSDRKGVNVPGVVLPLSPLTEKDRGDLQFGLDLGVDYVALSFVQRPEDVAEARRLIAGRAAVMVKLEKPAAIEKLGEIVELSDAVMVARGDLGVEMPPEEVPVLQKRIVATCRAAGKPVIVATQMLESMVHAPAPTRAEASDVATAVYDGADAVMLSAESAVGSYPREAVAMMNRIIVRTESDPNYRRILHAQHPEPEATSQDAITAAAAQVATTIKAAAVVTYTSSGTTTLRMSRERPASPILCITAFEQTARRLALAWGVHSVHSPDVRNFTEMVNKACRVARSEGLADRGQRVVITAGVPFGTPGATNILRIAWVE